MVWVFCADLFLPRCSGSTIQDPDHFEWHQRCVGETLWGRTYPKLFPVHYLQTSFYTIIFTGYIIELRWCNRIECISKVKLYDLYGKIKFHFCGFMRVWSTKLYPDMYHEAIRALWKIMPIWSVVVNNLINMQKMKFSSHIYVKTCTVIIVTSWPVEKNRFFLLFSKLI